MLKVGTFAPFRPSGGVLSVPTVGMQILTTKGSSESEHEPVPDLGQGEARGHDRSRARGARAQAAGRRRPPGPARCSAPLWQDDPAWTRAQGGRQRGDAHCACRSPRRPDPRRNRDADRAGIQREPEGIGAPRDRCGASLVGHRRVARRRRIHRRHPFEPEDGRRIGVAPPARAPDPAGGEERHPQRHRLRRGPGHPQCRRRRRHHPQRHPAPGRRCVLPLRRIIAEPDEQAVCEPLAPVPRPRAADGARAAAHRQRG